MTRSRAASTLLGVRWYALATALTAAMVLASSRAELAATGPLLLLFVIPILVVAHLGGLWPGLFATVVAALASCWFLPPPHSFRISLPGDRLEWALLWLIGIAVSCAAHVGQRQRASAEAARERYRNSFARQLQASAAEAKATRFQRFTRDAPIGIVFAGTDGTIQFANDEYLRIVGCTREELESEWARGEQGAAFVSRCGSGDNRCEKEIVRRDGTRVPVLIGVSTQPDGFAAFVIDMTSEKAAQRAREETEERFRTLADNIAQLAWIADPRGRIVWRNQRWVDFVGSSPAQTPEAAWQSAIHPAHRARVVASVERCLATGQVWEDTFPARATDGRYRWFLSRAVPIRDEQGNVARWFGTSTDVTKLREAEEELQEANRRKSEFLGVLSHELRNPLAPIRNSVYVLDRCEPDGEQARRARAVIRRQVDHLTRLVDDLLDVTRIARGRIELRRAPVNLNDLVRQSGEDHRDILEAHGLELSLEIPEDEVWVDGDATRLSQIVGNLLQNAKKFSSEGGSVELALVAAAQWAEIHVRDTGAGIAPELLEQMFEPFVQAERTLARSQGGLGLGLALVKGLTELHGGSVRASSPGLGRGSEFVVRLPVIGATKRVERPADGAARKPPRRVRVLVVEDNDDVAQSLAQLVELLGHDVEIAHDGKAALLKARAHPPDIVLCDIGLPGMSGFDVARVFRADPALHNARLVAVTGYAQPEDRKEAAEAGFEWHVAKPADPDEIERLLAT